MYNLSVDEISMVDGGGDGNSSGYPASPSAVEQMSGSQGDWGRQVLCQMGVAAATAAVATAAVATASGYTSVAAAMAAGASFGGAVCGRM